MTNEMHVIMYLPSCLSKHVWLSLLCGTRTQKIGKKKRPGKSASIVLDQNEFHWM